MEKKVRISKDPINTSTSIEHAKDPSNGAIVTFTGIVRDDSIDSLLIEAYEEMAIRDLESIADEAIRQYGLTKVNIEHRTGPLFIGETIVHIVCGAGHRKEAFLGCEYIIERLKERVPIWKKEYRKGSGTWVHSEHE